MTRVRHGKYTIDWDDGFKEAYGYTEDEGWYGSDEIVPISDIDPGIPTARVTEGQIDYDDRWGGGDDA